MSQLASAEPGRQALSTLSQGRHFDWNPASFASETRNTFPKGDVARNPFDILNLTVLKGHEGTDLAAKPTSCLIEIAPRRRTNLSEGFTNGLGLAELVPTKHKNLDLVVKAPPQPAVETYLASGGRPAQQAGFDLFAFGHNGRSEHTAVGKVPSDSREFLNAKEGQFDRVNSDAFWSNYTGRVSSAGPLRSDVPEKQKSYNAMIARLMGTKSQNTSEESQASHTTIPRPMRTSSDDVGEVFRPRDPPVSYRKDSTSSEYSNVAMASTISRRSMFTDVSSVSSRSAFGTNGIPDLPKHFNGDKTLGGQNLEEKDEKQSLKFNTLNPNAAVFDPSKSLLSTSTAAPVQSQQEKRVAPVETQLLASITTNQNGAANGQHQGQSVPLSNSHHGHGIATAASFVPQQQQPVQQIGHPVAPNLNADQQVLGQTAVNLSAQRPLVSPAALDLAAHQQAAAATVALINQNAYIATLESQLSQLAAAQAQTTFQFGGIGAGSNQIMAAPAFNPLPQAQMPPFNPPQHAHVPPFNPPGQHGQAHPHQHHVAQHHAPNQLHMPGGAANQAGFPSWPPRPPHLMGPQMPPAPAVPFSTQGLLRFDANGQLIDVPKPRDHSNPQLQMAYEAAIEWKKANIPGYAQECRERQSSRFANKRQQHHMA